MTHRIEPGQTYYSLYPGDTLYGGRPRRIRVVKLAPDYPAWGWSKTRVETVLPDGRGTRERGIETTQLHASPTTADGQPRRTGYALEQPCSTPHHQHSETVCTEDRKSVV